MSVHCCDERRLEAVRQFSTLNGIEYLEVLDRAAPSPGLRQRILYVHCLRALPTTLDADNVIITGGERIPGIALLWAARADALPAGEDPALADPVPAAERERVLLIRCAYYGDFSMYTLRLVAGPDSDTPPADFDPRLVSLDFSFKVECPGEYDCVQDTPCVVPPIPTPRIDYLAKDYASFRRLILDRLAVIAPQWRERNIADLGMSLVELLAYVGDELSYRQDMIATEAYLGTARRRVSLRRHARLMDYKVHEGCNARAWIQFTVSETVSAPAGTVLFTQVPGLPERIVADSNEWREALARRASVFETLSDVTLRPEHDRFAFYTWGDRRCCLARGATQATLAGAHPNLAVGDVLVFVEERGPNTGQPADADRSHRHAVHLTAVQLSQDPVGGIFLSPPVNAPAAVTEIAWDAEDALPFPLCLSAVTDTAHGEVFLAEVSAALGNIALADHGRTLRDEATSPALVPEPWLWQAPLPGQGCGRPDAPAIPPRFQPALAESPLTRAMPAALLTGPAARARRGAVSDAEPVITLTGVRDLGGGQTDSAIWHPRFDLLASGPEAREFVVETEHDGRVVLRFGDDHLGKRPDPGTTFSATYRVGNGVEGNVGAESIVHLVSADARMLRVSNPLPAFGGQDPESAEAIRRDAPEAYRVQERAVTAADYAEVSERLPFIQRAAASFRWTGSWHTVFLTVDAVGGEAANDALDDELRQHVERYRIAGYDLDVDTPRFVPLDVAMHVCVKPDYFRADVGAALRRVFGRGWLPDGRPALFHPDNFSFGQSVYLSELYAAAQAVEGVASVQIQTFQRLYAPDSKPLDDGFLALGRLEIARLDNDPNFPERGRFRLSLGGGK